MKDPDKEFINAEELAFKSEHKPIEHVYIDLEYMQDLKLGALINRVTVPEELSYIVHMLDGYNDRLDRKTAKYFKALHVTEEQLDEDVRNPKYMDKICTIAPFTSIYYRLHMILASAINHTRAVVDKFKPLKLSINCADVKYPDALKKKLMDTLSANMNISAEFISTKRYEMDDSEYLCYDLMMLYDYGDFIKQHASAFISSGKYNATKIIAQPYIEDAILAKTEDPDELLDYTERNIDVYCDFSYLRSKIWLNT